MQLFFGMYQGKEPIPEFSNLRTQQPKESNCGFLFLVVVSLVSGMAALSKTSINLRESFSQIFPSNKLSEFSNDYSSGATITVNVTLQDYDNPMSASLMPWDIITEPAKKNTLHISNVTVNGVSQDYTTVEWMINDHSYYGSSVEVSFAETGSFSSYVTVKSNDITYIHHFTLANKYIRREIRSLSDTDRETFFAVFHSLYTVNQSTGEELYGAKYASMATLTGLHLYGAGRTDCDHWHDGGGIITHHTAFTLQCEQSLQAIDPTIAMPYWEYSMDGELYTDYTWVDSEVFQSDWFGAASPDNEDHVITSGLWAFTDMPNGDAYADWNIAEEGSLNPYINAYGVMRAPWNNNPQSSIGRYNFSYGSFLRDIQTRPSCAVMSVCYNSSTLTKVKLIPNATEWNDTLFWLCYFLSILEQICS